MKSLLGKIDTALGSIYEIDTSIKSADYVTRQAHPKKPGVLLIRNDDSEAKEVEVAIAFNSEIKTILEQLSTETFASWSLDQNRAFSVIAEEISHFRYFIFHAEKNRQISQLELEFQGDIDKFLLFYLLSQNFDLVYAQLFESFSLSSDLTTEEKERYLTANQLAREFITKNRSHFGSIEQFSDFLKALRALYRMSPQDKFSLKHRL